MSNSKLLKVPFCSQKSLLLVSLFPKKWSPEVPLRRLRMVSLWSSPDTHHQSEFYNFCIPTPFENKIFSFSADSLNKVTIFRLTWLKIKKGGGKSFKKILYLSFHLFLQTIPIFQVCNLGMKWTLYCSIHLFNKSLLLQG